MAPLEISHLISQIQSCDFSFANINEQPYVCCGRFYPVEELSGCPEFLWEQGYVIGKVDIRDIYRPNSS